MNDKSLVGTARVAPAAGLTLVKWKDGSALIAPAAVVAITDFQHPQDGRVLAGHCVLMFAGGGMLAVPLTKESAHDQLQTRLALAE